MWLPGHFYAVTKVFWLVSFAMCSGRLLDGCGVLIVAKTLQVALGGCLHDSCYDVLGRC